MEDRSHIISRNLFQWVGIPLMLGFVGYFFVGPSISGGKGLSKTSEESPDTVVSETEASPRRASNRGESEEWVPPNPPQVKVRVIKDYEDDGDEADDLMDEDQPVPPPIQIDGEDGDEAGIGGLMNPPVDDGTGDNSDDTDDGSGDGVTPDGD